MSLDLEASAGDNTPGGEAARPRAARQEKTDTLATQPLHPDTRTLAERLASLSDSQFAQVFYEAVARRERSGLDDWQCHFVLGEAERVAPGPWEVDFIAPAREDVDDPDRVVCRETTCPRCRTRVRSWARIAGCPVCARTVYCT